MTLCVKIPDTLFEVGGRFYGQEKERVQIGVPINIGGPIMFFAKNQHKIIEDFQFRPNLGRDYVETLRLVSDGLVQFIKEGVAATTIGKSTQYDLSGGTGSVVGVVQPDVTRNLVLTITDVDVSISAMQITVTGVLGTGKVGTEVFTDTVTQIGTVPFNSVDTIVIDSIVGHGALDTLDIGHGSLYGSQTPTELVALFQTYYQEL